MLENVPAVKDACANGKCMFGTIESWLIYNLTGGKNGGLHVTDVSNASRYMLMELSTQTWHVPTCDMLQIPVKALPKIVSNSEVYGRVAGFEGLDGTPQDCVQFRGLRS